MRVLEGRLLLGATDLTDFTACEHLTQLSRRAASGEPLRAEPPPLAGLLARLGDEHETAWIDARRHEGARVKRFNPDTTRVATSIAELEGAAAETEDAMRDGWDIIYQPFFFDGVWQGRADFLVRIARPSLLGAHDYEVYDAKLARHVRAEALLQLCEYSLHVARVTGAEPERIHVVLGDGSTHSFQTADYSAYHRRVREQLVAALRGADVYPEKVAHCSVCEYAALCDARRHADSHLSLVARMRRDQVRKLNGVGILRMEELAASPATLEVDRMAPATVDGLREQARLQVEGRDRGDQPPLWELLPQDEPGFGLSALPAPSPGDVFFDMEGDPFALDGPLEYLFGAVELLDGTPVYRSWLGHTPAEERFAFEGFIDWLMQRLETHPDMHVYHYADYERSALQRLMGRHRSREEEVDRVLRGGVLVDLYRVVRQSVRLSTEGYGLKQVERLYMPPRDGGVADAESSVVMYAEWARSKDGSLLDSIVRYNEVDCLSTWRLRDWLEERRRAHELATGVALTRPAIKDGTASDSVVERQDELEAILMGLLECLPPDPASRSSEQQGTWLLAQLLDYHWREQKVGWWRWYRHIEMTEDELADDREALGPLTFEAVIRKEKQSQVMRYRFDPQEHALRLDDRAYSPVEREGARVGVWIGRVLAIENVRGTVDLLRGERAAQHAHPAFLIPRSSFGTPAQAGALLRIGESVAALGIDSAGPFRAARDLLLRHPPRRTAQASGSLRGPGESAEVAAVRTAAELDAGCLAVQGPPGAGKTFTAAHIAVELAARGRRVAVTATAHKVIARLLDEIGEVAASRDRPVRIMQKCDEHELCAAADVRRAGKNEEVFEALDAQAVDVVGGTAWLFAADGADGRFDTLLVDEAAQMSLADALAASRCARNLVLVGDPRQLAQVVQGSHPDGVGVSALAHLLQDRPTVSADTGIFLDRTWRMAPEVCAYVSQTFYQGKLEPVDACASQAIYDDDGVPLRGLQALLVSHEGDRTYSEAEARAVSEIVAQLLGRRWRHRDGTERSLGRDDIVVVAPYNAHVACLSGVLPEGIRVGTVDRFQGQEAAVSIFSMATSGAEDLPRNLEFLYSSHRLNVAVSRARCLTVLVHSPALLRTHCRTPEQMRLVNALCRYAEVASPWLPPSRGQGVQQLSLLPQG